MVEKHELTAGDRVIQNDPEEPTDNPFKGTVLSIETPTHTPGSPFWIKIQLDEEFRKQYRIQCPDGEMLCFPWQINKLT